MEDNDDVYEKVKAPCWANSLQEANADVEEADDSFFPEPPEIEEVTKELAHVALQEDPEDLSRLAMFGNKRQIKRRSQIKREQEVVDNQRCVRPSAPPKRADSLSRSSSTSWREARNPVTPRNSGPITRSQTRVIPKISVPIPPAVHGNRGLQRSENTFNRAPVMVRSSPRPTIAFGSAVRQKPLEPRTSVIRPRRDLPKTPSCRAPPLRSYPTPSGVTPARHLTNPETPMLLRRRPGSIPPRNRMPLQNRTAAPNIQGMVERLSRPKSITTLPMATPTKIVPNTYTHGIHSTKVRRNVLPR